MAENSGAARTSAHRRSIADSAASTEGLVRQAGKDFLVDFYTALRSLKLYPVENDQVQKSLDELDKAARVVSEIEGSLEVKISGDFLFVNGTRIRHDTESVTSFSEVIDTLRRCGVGSFGADESADRGDWQVFALTLVNSGVDEPDLDHLQTVREQLDAGGTSKIVIAPPMGAAEVAQVEDVDQAKQTAKRTYERGVVASKQLINSVRMGRTASVKQVKRAVQGVVDQVLGNETSLMGLTTIRDYDEYTFTHSLNVCIFSISMGKRLGLDKLQLYDLGMAALLHDIGKSRIPVEVLNKEGPLDEDEWRLVQAHPWVGALTLFGLRGYGEIPYRSAIAAYEHHMKIDLTGYPKSIRPRKMSLFSKIIAVADGFDAATTRRSYQTEPLQPSQVLQEMWRNPKRGMDGVLVKGMINLLGIYPVGSCVLLNTSELGVVHAAKSDTKQIDRPLVRILVDTDGQPLSVSKIVDLAETDAHGNYTRSIQKVVDPAKLGIDPGAQFT